MPQFKELKAYTRRRGGALSSAAPASVWYDGQLFTFLATAEDTGGQITFFEGLVPKGYGPPPHIHTREDEALYVVDGHIQAHVEQEVFDAPAGTFIFLPRNKTHWFTLVSDEARLLAFVTPAGHEGFFFKLAEPAQRLEIPPHPPRPPAPEFVERVHHIGAEHGLEFPKRTVVGAHGAPPPPDEITGGHGQD